MSPPVPWGTHREFVRLYEQHFLAASLEPHGRAALVKDIGAELVSRNVNRLLDCAAGTGFPALDLFQDKEIYGLDLVHVCDGDRTTVRELMRQAKERGIALGPLNPRLRLARTPLQALDDLVINWRGLEAVRGTYDYVMCRGNALAYADTWSGLGNVSPMDVIQGHLAQMAARVEIGGYLHIDAPWILAPRDGPSVMLDTPDRLITEEIKEQDDHREWKVHFTEIDQKGMETTISFRRLSSRLTIHDVREELGEVGHFEDAEPFQLKAERRVYGTIIAQKVR